MPADPTLGAPGLERIRAELPALERETYLNTGGAGPMPVRAVAAIAESASAALARGRMGLPGILDADAAMAALRAQVARLLGSDAERVAIAQNTTHAVNVVLWGLDWEPGDEVITTALEHPGVAAPLHVLAERRGVRLRVVPLEEAHDDLAGAVVRLAGPKTRLLAISHVAYVTGARLDVSGAAAAARGVGALTLVDGAQSAGAIPVDPEALGVDAYAIPAQKWLLGPEGLGALWISRAASERVALTFAGYESGEGHQVGGGFQPFPGARRYELSTPPLDLVAGWAAALSWLEGLGWDRVFAETLSRTATARERLSGLPGVRILTPPGEHAGLISFTVAGREPSAMNAALSRRGVSVRPIEHPPCLRASIGFFTSERDLERLLSEISACAG